MKLKKQGRAIASIGKGLEKWFGGDQPSGQGSRPPGFLVAAGSITAVAIALPLLYLVIRAAGAGLEEVWTLLSRPRTLDVLVHSSGLAVAVTLFSALISLPLAFLTERTDLPGRRFWAVSTTLPLAVPSYVGSFALIAAFGPRGSWLQLLLEPFGVEELPSIYGWFGAILALTLFTYPYLLIALRSGLQGIDPAIEEASRTLGNNAWATFWQVTLPQLRPSLVAGGLLVALYSLRDFGTPSLMRFDSFTRVIFIQYRSSFNRNSAAVLSLVLVALLLVILVIEYRVRTGAAYYSSSSGGSRTPTRIPLGGWKWPAIAFCSLITTLGLVLPIAVTLFWLWRGLNAGKIPPDVLATGFNSILASGLSAMIATLFALPVAILSVRFPGRITTVIERLTYIGFGLPGIVVALSLVFIGANYVPFFYQTLPMLVFAYLVLFLPQSVGTIRSSLLQVNPQLEESARTLGRTPWQTLREITLPLVSPGVLGGAVLVFLTAIKELPATMLLAPIGFKTLATQIWQATEDVQFTDAAAASLTLLLVSAGSTLVLLWRNPVKN
jgi:iron(III) transport system permease protein